MKKLLAVAFLFISVISFAQLSITHNMPASISPGKSQDIEFTITKGSVGGFAKFQCDLPFGFTATNIDSKSGNFTFENQRLKIVWVSVPGDASFTFKFSMGVPANAINSATIAAKFFYLENNVKKELDMPSHTIKFGDGVASTPTNTVATTPTNTVTSTPTNTVATTPTNTVTSTPTNTVATTPTNTVTSTPTNTVATTPTNTVTSTPTNTVATTPTNTVTSTPTNTVTSTPTKTTSTPSSSGITYKIQLGAFSSSPSKSKFPGVNFTVSEEGGYFKALSGNFNNIDDALKHKSELSAKGYQGFIVAYKNGQRIGLK